MHTRSKRRVTFLEFSLMSISSHIKADLLLPWKSSRSLYNITFYDALFLFQRLSLPYDQSQASLVCSMSWTISICQQSWWINTHTQNENQHPMLNVQIGLWNLIHKRLLIEESSLKTPVIAALDLQQLYTSMFSCTMSTLSRACITAFEVRNFRLFLLKYVKSSSQGLFWDTTVMPWTLEQHRT